MFRILTGLAVAFCALALMIDVNAGGGKDKDKELTVKEIMVKAHGKDGLRKKVIDGKASNEEKKALIDLYTAMAAIKWQKGDAKDWETRTAAVVEFVKAGTPADLKKVDCMGCHKAHK